MMLMLLMSNSLVSHDGQGNRVMPFRKFAVRVAVIVVQQRPFHHILGVGRVRMKLVQKWSLWLKNKFSCYKPPYPAEPALLVLVPDSRYRPVSHKERHSYSSSGRSSGTVFLVHTESHKPAISYEGLGPFALLTLFSRLP